MHLFLSFQIGSKRRKAGTSSQTFLPVYTTRVQTSTLLFTITVQKHVFMGQVYVYIEKPRGDPVCDPISLKWIKK